MTTVPVLIKLAAMFGGLSLLAVGGGSSILAQMQTTVVAAGWMDAETFAEYYSLGQLAPGPSMLMVLLIGQHVAGLPGAVVVTTAFFAPSCGLAWLVHRLWRRFEGNPWLESVAQGLAPVAVGLLFSGFLTLARPAVVDGLTLAVLGGATAIMLMRNHPNPAWLILIGGLVTWLRGYP